jgi:hypothetical protein
MPGLVPGIPIMMATAAEQAYICATRIEMAGHQGVHARLRRAMPGHDD